MSQMPSFSSLTTPAEDPAEIDSAHPNISDALDAALSKSLPLAFGQKARGIRERIIRFTPSWFSVTMVSGLVTI